QVHLVAGGISWPALNQTVCALRFLYGVTLKQAELPERIPYAREPQKLPVVLGADEVVRFLEAVSSLKARAALTTAYAAGLRASEAASLKVGDIDSSRMVIRIEQGKGGRDRYVMLSAQLLDLLRSYWRMARPVHWLFPGRDPEHPIHGDPGVPDIRARRSCRGVWRLRAGAPGPAPPPASALHCPERRPVAGSDKLDLLSARILPACARPLAAVPQAVPRTATSGVRGWRIALLR